MQAVEPRKQQVRIEAKCSLFSAIYAERKAGYDS
jgi:hypothetical protein